MPSDSLDGVRRRPADSPLTPDPNPYPQPKEKCPRCESRDTKFCYYNNYNTSQPRHFCRSCRRYWTLGGSLRNVPIGGSSRKRLRPNPNPNANPPANCHVPVVLPLEPFRSELGLGLGTKQGPGPSGFGLGPTELVWPSSMLVEGGDVGHCFTVPAPGDGSGGPTDGEVR